MTGPRKWTLRARLLAGLIAVTAIFLIVMGVVSTIVLSTLEQDSFSADLTVSANETPEQIARLPAGYGAAFYNVPPVGSHALRQVGPLDDPPYSAATNGLVKYLTSLSGTAGAIPQAYKDNLPPSQFTIALKGYPTLTVTFRYLGRVDSRKYRPVVPDGENYILVGRTSSSVGSEVRGVVLAELLTGGLLLTLLALAGRWLIARGLAPLEKMASTADVITSQGDLTARMPDPGDHAEASKLAAAINTMLDRIQQAFGARWTSEQKVRQFAADASHELRTPLTTIRGYAELYRQGALGETELPNAMRRIEQEADRMSSLVAELLELARLDRTSSLDLSDVDLSELVRDAAADARAVEPDRRVTAQAPDSFRITVDEPRLRQVLANLLGNVREHTPPGTPVAVRLSRAGEGALLEVADAGPGMTEEESARAFDRFYRSAHNGTGGSGLGLSIVQAIAAAHGGHAMLRSVAGVGTTVQVWIPFRSSDAERPMIHQPN
jgi:two-component system, OmpR family, sensor kinase